MRELIKHVDSLLEGSRQIIARSAATLADGLLPVLADSPNAVVDTTWPEHGSTVLADCSATDQRLSPQSD